MEGSNEELTIGHGFSPLKIFGHRIQQVIMPIFAIADGEIIPRGTGFVISPDGLMMTAKHVIDEIFEKRLRKKDGSGFYKNVELYAMYMTNKENEEFPGTFIGGNWSIDFAWYVDGLDIAYCWLRQATINNEPFKFKACLRLSPGLPKIGQRILGFGYHKSEAIFTGNIVNRRKEVEYKQNTAFTDGEIQELFYPRRDSSLMNFPCFQTTARFDGGMSGGPIFNGDTGGVCGVICDSFGEPDENGKYTSFGSLIWPSLSISLEVKTNPLNKDVEKITVYELIKQKHIGADDTFDMLKFSRNGDKISLELKH